MDGFDECLANNDGEDVKQLLHEVLELKLEHLHIILTSKWEEKLYDLCRKHGGVVKDLRTYSKELQTDIKTVVDTFTNIQDEIKIKLLQSAGIMYMKTCPHLMI